MPVTVNGMKNILFAAVGAIALSSCSLMGTKEAAVSGQLRGFDANQNLRIALVGYSNGQYVATSEQAQIIDKYLTGGFTITLPSKVPNGTYRLVVFRDLNNNEKLDTGDAFVSRDNGKLLVLTSQDDQFFQGTKLGWNIYDTTTREVQSTVLNNYDLGKL